MRRTINKRVLVLALSLVAIVSAQARSLVIELTNGTKVYYKLSNDAPAKMVIAQDGTFTLNTREYNFLEVSAFSISSTDYDGSAGTEDAIALVEADGQEWSAQATLYSLDGKALGKAGELQRQRPGTYVISNGKKSIKIQKQ